MNVDVELLISKLNWKESKRWFKSNHAKLVYKFFNFDFAFLLNY